MPQHGNFTWDEIERPEENTSYEVGDGKAYTTLDEAVGAAEEGDTIKVYQDDGTSFSFILGAGSVLEVGEGKEFSTVQDAYDASGADDTILVYEGTYFFEGNEYYNHDNHSLLIEHDIRIIGVGDVRFEASGQVAKGILVTAGTQDLDVYIENIIFYGGWSSDYNGAAIRHQSGNLVVVDSAFYTMQKGILGNDTSQSIQIYGSEFHALADSSDFPRNHLSHAIYGKGGILIVEESEFYDTANGHHIKSVATDYTIVANNYLFDGTGGASYGVDATGGGGLLVLNNTHIRGEFAENNTFVYYSGHRSGGTPGEVVVEGNVFDASGLPSTTGAEVLVNITDSVASLINNTITGIQSERIAIGLAHIEGNTLNGVEVGTRFFDHGATYLTEEGDLFVSDNSTGDRINAGEGDDTLLGSGDADTLWGGQGHDYISGGDENDRIYGGLNDDTLYGGEGSDILAGEEGNDLLGSGSGSGKLYGGVGNDTLFADGDDRQGLIGGTGDDFIVGSSSGRDTISGGGGDDIIFGGDGEDLINAGEGDDIVVYLGTFGDDSQGAAGNDFYVSAHWGGAYKVSGFSDTARLQVGDGYTTWTNNEGVTIVLGDSENLYGVEYIQFDNGVYHVLTETFNADEQLVDIDAMLANLPADVTAGAAVIGTDADDTFTVELANSFSTYEGLDGFDQIEVAENNVIIRLSNFYAGDVEEIDAQSYSGISIRGSSVSNYLDFSGTLITGVEKIEGGEGNDTIIGSVAGDTIIGGFGNDLLSGGCGDDIFEIGLGSGLDYIDGGSGSDTIRILAHNTVVFLSNDPNATGTIEFIDTNGFTGTVLRAADSANMWDFSGVGYFGQVTLELGGGNDTILGSLYSDTIAGGSGNDVLSSGSGDDLFLVGLDGGYDRFDGGAGDDTIRAVADNAFIGFHSSKNQAVRTGLIDIEVIDAGGYSGVRIVGSDDNRNYFGDIMDFTDISLIGIEGIFGQAGKDNIKGSTSADTISGGADDDVLSGGAGDDVFLVGLDEGNDRIDGGAGIDTIRATADNVSIGFLSNSNQMVHTGLVDVEVIDAGGFESVRIVGSDDNRNTFSDVLDFTEIALIGIEGIFGLAGNDSIIGTTEADTISGGADNDVLYGGEGDDVFLVGLDEGNDRIDGGAGIDTIRATADNVSIGFLSNSNQSVRTGLVDVEVIDAGGFTGVMIVGSDDNRNTFRDIMDFSNVDLVGIAGIAGQSGSDTIIGSTGDDKIWGGADNDFLQGGSGDDTLLGEGGNDYLTGADGTDNLYGGDGDDTLLGGDDYDRLWGGAGSNLLDGGNGHDVVNYA
ncbi:MAG: hypothetical protein HWE25_01990, partial [Alphaproteobacteria bacterium]|nr:hypothetical protein [Alphaproteobacteria bacterium]